MVDQVCDAVVVLEVVDERAALTRLGVEPVDRVVEVHVAGLSLDAVHVAATRPVPVEAVRTATARVAEHVPALAVVQPAGALVARSNPAR